MPHSLIHRLRQRLSGALPERAAFRAYAPELAYGRHRGPAPCHAKPAAVLLLLYEYQQQWHVPLTVRSAAMPSHAGQVSFPGGMIEPGETPEAAAVREVQEEIGVVPERITLLGRLSPIYVFGSNYLITPCVAVACERPAFQLHAHEVAALLEAPLRELAQPTRHGAHIIDRGGVRFRAPHIEYEDEKIWGATCLILAEFLVVLRELEAI